MPHELPHLETYSFRPAGIQPDEPVADARGVNKSGSFLLPIFAKVLPSMVVRTSELGRTLVKVALEGDPDKGGDQETGVFENVEIKQYAAKVSPDWPA